MQDRRKEPRHRTLRGGKIFFNNKNSVIDCTVRNLSPEGASLQVDSVVGIPRSFDLHVEGETGSRPCRVIWQSETRIGVSFNH